MAVETSSTALGYTLLSVSATAIINTWIDNMNLSLLLCSISGALTFMFWNTTISWWQKLAHFFIGTVVGYIFSPIVAAWPFTPNIEPQVYALFISSLCITLVHKVLAFVTTHTLAEIVQCLRDRGAPK